jgi:hypothetical protein
MEVSISTKSEDYLLVMGMYMVGRYKKRVFLEEKSFHYENQ